MVTVILELRIQTHSRFMRILNNVKMSTKKYSDYTNGKRQTLLETKNAYENSIDKEIEAMCKKSTFRPKSGASSSMISAFNDWAR